MNWLCIREASASAWPCLVDDAPSTSATTSSMRTCGGQRQHRAARGGRPRRAPRPGTRAAGPLGARKASAAVPIESSRSTSARHWPGRPAAAGRPGRRGRRGRRRRAGRRGRRPPCAGRRGRGRRRRRRRSCPRRPGSWSSLVDGQPHASCQLVAVVAGGTCDSAGSGDAQLRAERSRSGRCVQRSHATPHAAVTYASPQVAVPGATPRDSVRSPWTADPILGEYPPYRGRATRRIGSKPGPPVLALDGRPSWSAGAAASARDGARTGHAGGGPAPPVDRTAEGPHMRTIDDITGPATAADGRRRTAAAPHRPALPRASRCRGCPAQATAAHRSGRREPRPPCRPRPAPASPSCCAARSARPAC